jgi:hypothetical protein
MGRSSIVEELESAADRIAGRPDAPQYLWRAAGDADIGCVDLNRGRDEDEPAEPYRNVLERLRDERLLARPWVGR